MASLRSRVLASVLLLAAAGLVLLAAVTYAEQRSFLQGRVDQEVRGAVLPLSFQLDRLGLRPGRWDASLFVDNLLGSHDRTSIFHDVPTSTLVRYTSFRPRTFGVTASYRY